MAWYWWVGITVIEAVFVYFLMANGYFDRFINFCSEHFLMLPVYMVVIVLLLPGLGLLAGILGVRMLNAFVVEVIRNRPQ